MPEPSVLKSAPVSGAFVCSMLAAEAEEPAERGKTRQARQRFRETLESAVDRVALDDAP
jgi:hypothetical protein